MWHTLKMEQTNSFWLIWILLRCARVLERIVNQNNYTDIALGLNYLSQTTIKIQCFRLPVLRGPSRWSSRDWWRHTSSSLEVSLWESQLNNFEKINSVSTLSFPRLESWKWLPSAGTPLTTISLLSLLDLVKDIDDSFDTSIKHKIQRCNVYLGVYDYDVV